MDKYYLSPAEDPKRSRKLAAFDRLLTIMDELRAGCPWDREQTFESLRYLTLEEVYELADAILEKDYPALEKELGDLMLHLVFYAKIGEEQGLFDVETVLNQIAEKLIHRHPHIYGDVQADSAGEVKDNWERIKLKEKGNSKSVLGGVPAALPALVKAIRMQEKAAGVGFDWPDSRQVWQKVEEEMAEFHQEAERGKDREALEEEFGDLLFSLVNYARFLGLNPENALERTNRKFIQRFRFMEQEAARQGRHLPDMTLEEMDELWEQAKEEQ